MKTAMTPGQESDDTGDDLGMADNRPQPAVLVAVLVADRGYGSDEIRKDIESRNALPFGGKTNRRASDPRFKY